MSEAGAARVLVVDDNVIVRNALAGIVRQDENLMLVGEARSGETALEAVVRLAPDVVCLDVLMPGMDGLEALRRIRESHPAVRVVIITGQATADVLKSALAAGAHGFVVKPFNASKVLGAIYKALGAGATQS